MYKRFELQCELRNEYRNPEWKEVGSIKGTSNMTESEVMKLQYK